MKQTLLLLLLTLVSCKPNLPNFVGVKDGKFTLSQAEYTYMGANYWQGMNLGAPESGDRDRLCRELDQMKANGITNLRILAASEADDSTKYCIRPALQIAPGIYNNDLWLGLDFLLYEMAKRDMKAVVVLSNFWTWSGGFAQYLHWNNRGDIPYPQDAPFSWYNYDHYTKNFFSDSTSVSWLNNHISKVVTRTNSISGIDYVNDPTIMSWQLANEPRGVDNLEDFAQWIDATSTMIKSLDKNHLVSLGSEGDAPHTNAGTDAFANNDYDNIDYITMHIWVQNWNWFSPNDDEDAYAAMQVKVNNYVESHLAAAQKLHKPLVLEEFGLARDSVSYDPDAPTMWRDRYYGEMFDKVLKSVEAGDYLKGVNIWAYSGEGRSPRHGEYWQSGDDLLGDPPHELQGWYGVYNTDSSTLKVIKAYSEKITNPVK